MVRWTGPVAHRRNPPHLHGAFTRIRWMCGRSVRFAGLTYYVHPIFYKDCCLIRSLRPPFAVKLAVAAFGRVVLLCRSSFVVALLLRCVLRCLPAACVVTSFDAPSASFVVCKFVVTSYLKTTTHNTTPTQRRRCVSCLYVNTRERCCKSRRQSALMCKYNIVRIHSKSHRRAGRNDNERTTTTTTDKTKTNDQQTTNTRRTNDEQNDEQTTDKTMNKRRKERQTNDERTTNKRRTNDEQMTNKRRRRTTRG